MGLLTGFFQGLVHPAIVPAYVIDTSLLLQGGDLPPTGPWLTTSEVNAEIRPGGRDFARWQLWQEKGLQFSVATREARGKVEACAQAAGNLLRLSAADISILALALDCHAVLVTDDNTMLDVANRLKIKTQTIAFGGITSTQDWQPRCSGCGKWFSAMPRDCPICGSEVRLKKR